jgi:hypothetical protein
MSQQHSGHSIGEAGLFHWDGELLSVNPVYVTDMPASVTSHVHGGSVREMD